MNSVIAFILQMLSSGAGNLAAYLAAHVLLCLLPAFFIAGAMSALIPKETVTRYLGRSTPKWISYPASAAAGFLLAVCSCTVIPLFAGIYKKGAGLGPAITFLFVAPAINILALTYTGTVIGADIAIARIVLSVLFGIGIGIIMSIIFHKEDAAHDKATDNLFAGQAKMRKPAAAFLLLMVALLVIGTFQIPLLKNSYATLTIPARGAAQAQAFFSTLVPFDASRGEEGVTLQGAVLIGMLVLIALAAWKGFEPIYEGINRWTWFTLILVGFTLLIAALGVTAADGLLTLNLTGKFFGTLLAVSALGWMLKTRLTPDEMRDTLWESWRFMKQIFPLLLAGVFVVGMVRQLIRPEWIESLAGSNTVFGNLVGVVFGVCM
ncbi:MAG: permease [Anaerolineaceae bacterium]